MAGRIAGITVEVNGSTTGLSKALESVNKTIKVPESPYAPATVGNNSM